MSTAPCGRCGEPAPEPLLRRVQLRVDGADVDDQTLCPDCFSDWIARYQEEMATDMPGAGEPETTDGDIRIAEEDESVRSHQFGSDDEDRLGDGGASGDEIRDLGAGRNSDDRGDVTVDLDGEATAADDGRDDERKRFD